MTLSLLGILASSAVSLGQAAIPAGEEAATPSLLEISLLDPGLLGSYPALPRLRDESDSEAPLVGAVIGGAAGAVVSILLAERATGSSAVHPLFVLGGILIGYGIGTAF